MDDPTPLRIVGGRVLGATAAETAVRDLAIVDGRFVDPGQLGADARQLDATGRVVAPGLVDMHTHLREPGFTHKETIASAATAAVHGGFTTICAMPNTQPPVDSLEGVRTVEALGVAAGMARVRQFAAITRGQAGRELVDFEGLVAAGVCGFSDDGLPVADPAVMVEALRRLAPLGRAALIHAEEKSLAPGPITAGKVAEALGVPGIDPLAEELMTLRDVYLAEVLGAKVHICHVSTARAVEILRRAKAVGAPVTAEVCPHHLLLTDEDVASGDTDFKMNPPLRTEVDIRALLDGLADGTIDAIASDHAPHTAEEKSRGLIEAPFGIVGLETTLPLVLTHVVAAGVLDLEEAVVRMSQVPAAILGLEVGRIAPGAPGDLVLIDPDVAWEIDRTQLHSKSQNTPFDGWSVRGRAVTTVVGGRVHALA